ncbi:hypothetical protein QOZ80_1BG0095320 [Eleusine coracana subsp. coracana]|nr:hypothetical protein QOZ80_1BG0095320 [Eleusine coracana subsp. coracana]
MGKKGKEAARERREQRRREVTHLRTVPYEPHQRWWGHLERGPARAVAVVTGANRGIGFEAARQLALHGLHVVVASRDAERGQAAAELIRAEASGEAGVSVECRQLDVADAASVKAFAAWAAETHGGIHVLINNVGVNFNKGAENSVEFAQQVIETNYYGTKRMIDAMIPLMKPSPYGGRIVNVSSRLGRVNGRRNISFLDRESVMLSDQAEGQKIYMNCFCPGWVKTAMTGWEGNISAEEGADTGVWLALLPQEQSTNGKFFAERCEISF